MTTTVTMTMPMLTAMMLTKMAMAINYDDDGERMMAIWYFRKATGPVAVIPLACGRLEPGLWPCGRLDTMVAGPVAVFSKMALDRDENDDDDDRDMFCVPPTLSVNGV